VVGSGEAVGLPSWSPDGAQLVFEGWAGGNAAPEVRRASLDGSDVEVLAQATSADWSCVAPVWSPDGREIAYASEGALRVRTVATGAVRTIATGRRVCRPAWSPDGRVVAFTHGDRDAPRLTIVGRSGGAPRELARRGFIDPYARPAWAPDGRSIAYGDYDPALGSMALRRVDIGDPDASSLAEADGTAPVHWSSDGSAILFTRWSDGGSIGLWNVEQEREEDFFPGPPALGRFYPVWLPR
jgi:Tol biopolymer transport system component